MSQLGAGIDGDVLGLVRSRIQKVWTDKFMDHLYRTGCGELNLRKRQAFLNVELPPA